MRDLAELSEYEIGMSSSHLGSGGMRSKVLAAEMATSAGIPVVICNGTRARDADARRRGARPTGRASIRRSARESSFKLWLKYAKATQRARARRRGRRAGAARAGHEPAAGRRGRGRGRLRGRRRGRRRRRAADGRRTVGKGISNYSAAELRSVKGLKSAAVRELLPRASEEAVHRDYFVLA